METNPYVSPSAQLSAAAETVGNQVSDALIQTLVRTKPWLRVVGVFMWIGIGVMLLASLATGFVGASQLMATTVKQASPAYNKSFVLGLSLLYFVFALIYIFPARRIWSCGSSIERLSQTRSVSDLQAVLEAQRSFWTFVGISFLLVLVCYGLLIVGAAVMGVLGATSR